MCDSLFDQRRRRLTSKPLPEQHGQREDLSRGIGNVLSGNVFCLTVSGLKHRPPAFRKITGKRQTARTQQQGGLVGQNIAEQVGRDHHVSDHGGNAAGDRPYGQR